MKSNPSNRSMISWRRGFSLIELLVVVAIIGVLLTLFAPVFNNYGKSVLLNEEGNRLVNTINLAGQNSASKNAMTAILAIPADSSCPASYSTFCLYEYVSEASGWTQVTAWQTLKSGIVVDPASFTFTDYPAVKPEPDFPVVTYRGGAISNYKYLVFLPNRSLLQSASAQMKLVEGNFPPGSGTPSYSRKDSGGNPANYYQVTVLASTGRPKVDRP